jgi:uncharacterized protein involved in exopolysaccharide biosynthesis
MGDTLRFLWSGSLLAVGTAGICALAAYFVTDKDAVQYEATATVYATGAERIPGGVTYAAASLDADAYAFAAVSEAVLSDALSLLGRSDPEPREVASLGRSISLSKDETSSASFVHISATSSSASTAADVANAVAAALIKWDTDRARTGLGRVAATLEAQIASLSEAAAELQGRSDPVSAQELAANIALRIDQQNTLRLIRALELEGSGSLALFQSASTPLEASGPRVTMNVVLGAMFGLVLGYAIVLVVQTLRVDRKVPVKVASSR